MCKGLSVLRVQVFFGGDVKVGSDKVVEEWLCGGGGSARFGADGRHGGRRSGSLEAGCRRIKADGDGRLGSHSIESKTGEALRLEGTSVDESGQTKGASFPIYGGD
jgi:hypothetical protein